MIAAPIGSEHVSPLPFGKVDATMCVVELLDAIREAIEASGKSRYQLARESGVAESALSRLMSRERGLSVGTVEQLAKALGLKIVLRRTRQRR